MAEKRSRFVLPLDSAPFAGAKRRRVVHLLPSAESKREDHAAARMHRAYLQGDIWRLIAARVERADDVARLCACCVHVRHALLTGPEAPAEIVYALEWLAQYGLAWLASTDLVFYRSGLPRAVLMRHARLPILFKADGTECKQHAVVRWRLQWLRDIVQHRDALLLRWLLRHWRCIGYEELHEQVFVDAAGVGWLEGVRFLLGQWRAVDAPAGDRIVTDLSPMHSHVLLAPRFLSSFACPAPNSLEYLLFGAGAAASYFGHREILEFLYDAPMRVVGPEYHQRSNALRARFYSRAFQAALLGAAASPLREDLLRWVVARLGTDGDGSPLPSIGMPSQLVYSASPMPPTTVFRSRQWSQALAVASWQGLVGELESILLRERGVAPATLAELAVGAIQLLFRLRCGHAWDSSSSCRAALGSAGVDTLVKEHFFGVRVHRSFCAGLEPLVALALRHGADHDRVVALLTAALRSLDGTGGDRRHTGNQDDRWLRAFALVICPLLVAMPAPVPWHDALGAVLPMACNRRKKHECHCVEWIPDALVELALQDWLRQGGRASATEAAQAAATHLLRQMLDENGARRKAYHVHEARVVDDFLTRIRRRLETLAPIIP